MCSEKGGGGCTWIFERRVLWIIPRPLSLRNRDVIKSPHIILLDLITAIRQLPIGQRIMALSTQALGIPHLIAHRRESAAAAQIEFEDVVETTTPTLQYLPSRPR